MIIKDMPVNERPRERLVKYGTECLSNEELLAIIIKSGTYNKSSKDLSLEILKLINDIDNVYDLTINKLMSVKGIGRVKAITIIATIEFGRRIAINNNRRITDVKMLSSKEIFEYSRGWFKNKKQECFYALYFDNKQRLIEGKLLFMGTINKSIVHPRELFKHAYLLSASNIVCIHNHPSGDINPSREDIILTKSLYEIGQVQCIPIIDHIIIGENSYYSFRDSEKIINM